MRANWGLTQGSLNMHGHKSSIISTYLVLCRNARSTILLTMFSLPFLSRRARDQVMHPVRQEGGAGTALLEGEVEEGRVCPGGQTEGMAVGVVDGGMMGAEGGGGDEDA